MVLSPPPSLVVAMGSQEGDTPSSKISKQGASWISVEKYEFDVSIQDGEQSVEVPDEVFKNADSLWEDFLVDHFLSTAPHARSKGSRHCEQDFESGG